MFGVPLFVVSTLALSLSHFLRCSEVSACPFPAGGRSAHDLAPDRERFVECQHQQCDLPQTSLLVLSGAGPPGASAGLGLWPGYWEQRDGCCSWGDVDEEALWSRGFSVAERLVPSSSPRFEGVLRGSWKCGNDHVAVQMGSGRAIGICGEGQATGTRGRRWMDQKSGIFFCSTRLCSDTGTRQCGRAYNRISAPQTEPLALCYNFPRQMRWRHPLNVRA